MSDTKTCEACGDTFRRRYKRPHAEFAKRRFCSRQCAILAVRQVGKPRSTHCQSGEHEMTEDNVRVDGRGSRSCRACAAARDAERRPSKAPRGPRRPRQVAKPVPAPPPVAAPVWRPPGWSTSPRI